MLYNIISDTKISQININYILAQKAHSNFIKNHEAFVLQPQIKSQIFSSNSNKITIMKQSNILDTNLK